jgi:hypothetical protein
LSKQVLLLLNTEWDLFPLITCSKFP